MKLTVKTGILLLLTVIVNVAVVAYWYHLMHKEYGGWTMYPPIEQLRNNDGFNLVMKNKALDNTRFMWALVVACISNVLLIVAAVWGKAAR